MKQKHISAPFTVGSDSFFSSCSGMGQRTGSPDEVKNEEIAVFFPRSLFQMCEIIFTEKSCFFQISGEMLKNISAGMAVVMVVSKKADHSNNLSCSVKW